MQWNLLKQTPTFLPIAHLCLLPIDAKGCNPSLRSLRPLRAGSLLQEEYADFTAVWLLPLGRSLVNVPLFQGGLVLPSKEGKAKVQLVCLCL